MMSFMEAVADYSENRTSMKKVVSREIHLLKVLIALRATFCMLVPSLAYSPTPNMEETRSSETSVDFQRFTRR
jgi:hypothetical protein